MGGCGDVTPYTTDTLAWSLDINILQFHLFIPTEMQLSLHFAQSETHLINGFVLFVVMRETLADNNTDYSRSGMNW